MVVCEGISNMYLMQPINLQNKMEPRTGVEPAFSSITLVPVRSRAGYLGIVGFESGLFSIPSLRSSCHLNRRQWLISQDMQARLVKGASLLSGPQMLWALSDGLSDDLALGSGTSESTVYSSRQDLNLHSITRARCCCFGTSVPPS